MAKNLQTQNKALDVLECKYEIGNCYESEVGIFKVESIYPVNSRCTGIGIKWLKTSDHYVVIFNSFQTGSKFDLDYNWKKLDSKIVETLYGEN